MTESNNKKQKLSIEFFPYTRINHFDKLIDSFLMKDDFEIPDELIVSIKAELAKRKIIIVRRNGLKQILRKLNYQQYYEYIPYIMSKLTGKEPVVLTLEDAGKLKIMFQQIQKPFEKSILGTTRTSFLNYTYVLYKLAELCGLNNMMQQCELLKSREKMLNNDKVWKNICEINGWPFIPTIKN